jgi:hypothetical protein
MEIFWKVVMYFGWFLAGFAIGTLMGTILTFIFRKQILKK